MRVKPRSVSAHRCGHHLGGFPDTTECVLEEGHQPPAHVYYDPLGSDVGDGHVDGKLT